MPQDSDILDGDLFVDRCAPTLARLHELWESKRTMDALPARAAFDPVEFRPWLGRLGLLDVLPGALPDGAARVGGGHAGHPARHGAAPALPR